MVVNLYSGMCCTVLNLCHAQLFATPWTVAHQAPLSCLGPRQEYWSKLPFPPPGDLPNSEIKPTSPALAGRFFTAEPSGKPMYVCVYIWVIYVYRGVCLCVCVCVCMYEV